MRVAISLCFLLIFQPIHPVKAETTLLILGDSLTAGYGLQKEQAFPHLLDNKLKEKGYTGIKVVNGGFSGSTTASAYGRMKWYMRIKPDILLLELGANDGLRGHQIQSITANLEKTIQFAMQNNIITVLAGMKLPINYGSEYTRNFEEMYRKLANKYKITFIPFLLEGVAGDPKLNLADGIHPNPEGHKIITETVYPYIEALLQSK